MVIQCDQCQTKFRLPDEKLKPGGVKVRCSHCKHVFTVMPPVIEPEEPAVAPAEAPVAAPPSAGDLSGGTEDVSSGFDLGRGDEPPFGQELEKPGDGLPSGLDSGMDFDRDLPSEGSGNGDEFPGGGAVETEGEQGGSSDEFAFDEEFGSSEFDFENETVVKADSDEGGEVKPEETGFSDEFDFGDEADNSGGGGPGEAVGPSEFDFEEELSTAANGTEEFGFEDEEAALSDEFDFGEEAGSADAFSFDEDAGPTEFEFEGEPNDKAGGGDDFGFEEESASPDDFDFGDESPFGPVDSESFEGEEKTFKFTELPVAGDDAGSNRISSSFEESTPEVFGGEAFEESFSQEEDFEPVPKGKKGKKSKGQKAQKGKGPLARVFRLILLLLLLLCVVAGYLFWQTGGVATLPSMDELVELVTGGGGTAEAKGQIELTGESGRYVVNKSAGTLLVIEGRAVNRYPVARAMIRVRGGLYDSQGKVLRTQVAYCGNRFSERDLQQLAFHKLEEGMNNTFGEALSNFDVASGKDIPFLIVFRDLPPNLDSFAVEVVDSQVASK